MIGTALSAKMPERKATLSGWFLHTRLHVASDDAEKHIAWLCDRLEGKETSVRDLLARGWRINISCFWCSACGHGGPRLSPSLLSRLTKLGVEISFDVYFHGANIRSEEDSPKEATRSST